MVECDICCEERPANRFGSCSAFEDHLYCFYCIKSHIMPIVASNNHVLACMEPSCKSTYPKSIVRRILDSKSFQLLERIEQAADLRGVNGLQDCPFCRFKCFIDEGIELHCQDPACGKISCTLCNQVTHWPNQDCSEAEKDRNSGANLNIRHLVEEAMSEAAFRKCPNCGLKIIKEGGCNHMHCFCGGSLCYVCKKPNISNQHFFNSGCPQFFHTTEEQEREVKRAETEAKAKVKKDHPEVTDKDLEIAMSSRVKQDDERKKNRDRREARGELWQPGMPIEGGDDDHLIGPWGPRMGLGLMPRFGGVLNDPVLGPPPPWVTPNHLSRAQTQLLVSQRRIPNRAAEEQERLWRNQHEAAEMANTQHQMAMHQHRQQALAWRERQADEHRQWLLREEQEHQEQAQRRRGREDVFWHGQGIGGQLRRSNPALHHRQQGRGGEEPTIQQGRAIPIPQNNLFANDPAIQNLRSTVDPRIPRREWPSQVFMGHGSRSSNMMRERRI